LLLLPSPKVEPNVSSGPPYIRVGALAKFPAPGEEKVPGEEKMTQTHKRMNPAIMAMVVCAALTPVAPAQELLREQFQQSYPLPPDGKVTLSNVNGAVRISAWGRAEVQVHAVKIARTPEALQAAKIEVTPEENTLRIRTRHDEQDGREGRSNQASVEYTVTIPRRASLDKIDLVNGALELDGMEGDTRASTVNGKLTAKGVSGNVRLSSVNGSVEMTLARPDPSKDVKLDVVNGSLTLILAGAAAARIRASTVNGGISNDFGLQPARQGFVGKQLEGEIGSGGGLIQLKSVNGTIRILKLGTI
jgi:DUF4097 and DUF4098 domain-containing protein YvlB